MPKMSFHSETPLLKSSFKAIFGQLVRAAESKSLQLESESYMRYGSPHHPPAGH